MIVVAPKHSFSYAGLQVATYHAASGEGLPMHDHTYNHATVCHAGSCVVRVKGKEIVMQPGTMPLDLPANIPHEIEALEDGTVFTNIFVTEPST
jgi:quercetin dioxygenase-like cupin family protein